MAHTILIIESHETHTHTHTYTHTHTHTCTHAHARSRTHTHTLIYNPCLSICILKSIDQKLIPSKPKLTRNNVISDRLKTKTFQIKSLGTDIPRPLFWKSSSADVLTQTHTWLTFSHHVASVLAAADVTDSDVPRTSTRRLLLFRRNTNCTNMGCLNFFFFLLHMCLKCGMHSFLCENRYKLPSPLPAFMNIKPMKFTVSYTATTKGGKRSLRKS